MELSGSEIIIQFLKDEGVEYLFGYPGGAVLHIYDALQKQDGIKHILVRHEQGATHAADGYARATGKPGVCLVTSGPGATNAITGIATAYMDSIPLVVITGQVPSHVIGTDAFQEVDAVGISRPCVKHNFLVKDLNKLASTLKKAFYIATTGRPGPVVIDIPKDITAPHIKIPYQYPKQISIRSYNPNLKGHPRQIKRAVELLLSARRPVIYSGGGVIIDEASKELRKFVRHLGYPITQTLMGLGAFPGTDPQFIGLLGMHGTYEANMAMHDCDVLIAIGARFDDRITGVTSKFCPYAQIIHIDIDPTSISKNINADIPIVGGVKQVLTEMLKILAKSKPTESAAIEAWWNKIKSWQDQKSFDYERHKGLIQPQTVIEELYKVTGGNAYITSDVGQHQMFAAQFYPFDEPRRWINSGGLGTMGFGLPAALGVKLAFPDKDVACVTGEGSIQMCIQELSTCLQYDAPVKIINLNNRYLGMVRQWQEFFYEKRYSHVYMDSLPDFVKLAEAYGHVGILVEDPDDLHEALKQAFALKDRTVFLDIMTDQEANVYPMISAGKAHNEMDLSPLQQKIQASLKANGETA
ncbi:MAG: acetolactate synthase 3 large subunit [Gammaproteobacteria bacterium]|nr:acetolactate synthase 3 large subunit [Gammaproteobacteria bacterium]MCZ6796976.1 acetolactate synthase 3 large subunit [Gammaproteobacteria bacterium]